MAECSTQPSGSGTSGDPYIITDVCELNWMRNDLDAYYELDNDIDASDTVNWDGGAGWTPIANFEGNLDGNGYTIWDLYINRTQAGVGLFNGLKTGAYVHEFYLKRAEVYGTYTTSEHNSAGAAVLCGIIYDQSPTIHRVGVHGTVSLDFTATQHILCGAGGLAGYVRYVSPCQITECFADVSVSATAHSGAWAIAGGFIGVWDGGVGGDIEDAYARGSATTATDYLDKAGGFIGYYFDGGVEYCYSTGAPSAENAIGGFIATGPSSEVVACFWDTQTSGTSQSAAGTGKTTAQMKTQSTFTDAGWDFTSIWSMGNGLNDGYPILQMLPAQAGSQGYLWIEGTKLAYTDANESKRTIEGTQDGATGQTAGHGWIEGNNFRYIDSSGNERYIAGTLDGATGASRGLWIEGTKLRYIDSSGNERYIEGTT